MSKKILETPTTLPFDAFWRWIQAHPNCIVRAGTPEAVLFDDDDLHWHFGTEDDGALLVQLIRGKKTLGELVIQPGDIAYVEVHPGDPDEFHFECVSESPDARIVAYHFVLSHGYDAGEAGSPGRFVH